MLFVKARLKFLMLFTALAVCAAGCDKFKGGAPSAASRAVEGEGGVSANIPRIVGRDAEDDPKAPGCLPPTQSNGTWTKREPIRVFGGAELGKVLSAKAAERCAPFRVMSAARCVYALKRSIGSPADAEVVTVETLTVEDAYGLLTCLSGSAETCRIGGEARIDRSGGLAFHCWQGKRYIAISSKETDSETTEEMIRLLMHICGKIPGEGPPAILSTLPMEDRRPGKLWLVRHLSSIPPDAVELGYSLDMNRVSTILGLGKASLICVCSYDVANAQRPNTVWVAEYPTIKAAHDAYARYARLIQQGSDPVALSASVLPAQGSSLVGTWTAEEESMQYLLPRISKLLPQ